MNDDKKAETKKEEEFRFFVDVDESQGHNGAPPDNRGKKTTGRNDLPEI